MHNNLFLSSIKRLPVARRPIWFMRQAGRYLPEYNQIRKKAGSFLNLCKTPELAVTVTLQPIERFHLDAAIIFSDILTIPDAMGLGLEFVEGQGPILRKRLRDEVGINQLRPPEPEATGYVMEAIRLCRQELDPGTPLIGFSGSPFTLACYMVEGQSSQDFFELKKLRYTRPDLLHKILQANSQAVSAYLCSQADAGAQVLMLFDTWGGLLSARDFREFSLAYIQQIIQEIKGRNIKAPIILFVKGGGQWLEEQIATGADAIGVDWTTPLAKVRHYANRVALQGNLDPLALLGNEREVREATRGVLTDFGSGPGHLFNLGHGIHPLTPIENVQAMVETVKNHDLR